MKIQQIFITLVVAIAEASESKHLGFTATKRRWRRSLYRDRLSRIPAVMAVVSKEREREARREERRGVWLWFWFGKVFNVLNEN